MEFSKATAVVLCSIILYYRGVCGLCNISLTTLTADCSNQDLHNVPSYVPNSIKVLDLSKNMFQEVNARQFKRFQNLETLILHNNHITHLNNDSDTELPNVRYLDLEFNKLEDLNGAFLASFPNLLTLDIGDNPDSLKVTMFKGLRNLISLDMSWMHTPPIRTNTTPFIELKYLEYLGMGYCGLSHLTDNTFNGIPNLLDLYLSSNYLTHLPSGLFITLTKLIRLDLRSNFIYYRTSLPTNIFKPLMQLEILILYLPPDEFYEFLDASFTYMDKQIRHIPTLKYLSITGAPNAKVGPGFTYLENLESLIINGNLSEINNETFANLRNNPSLKLSLNNCEFSRILPNAFATLGNVTSLEISFNNALCKENLWYNFTAGICNSRLKNVTATHLCKFTIYPQWTCEAPELEVLDISHNTIYDIISGLPVSLKELNLSANNIVFSDFMSISSLVRLRNLRILDLSDQTLGTRTIYTYFNRTVQNINLKARNMTYKDQVFTPFSISPYTIPPFLGWIDISKSGIMCSLCSLDNTNNSIKTLISSRFRPELNKCKNINEMLNYLWPWLDNLIFIEHLDLSGNKIKTIPAAAFTHTKNLKHLCLSDNTLVTLAFEIKYLGNVKEIYVSDNVIRYATNNFMSEIQSNDLTIYLDHNDILCDCARSSFIHWLDTSNVVYNIAGLMCKYENGSQVSLRHSAYIFQQLKYGCSYITLSCVIVFNVILLGGIVVGIILHRQWKIKYLSFFSRRTVNPYHPLEEGHIELEYDIYISYERDHDISENETLHALVAQKLYPWFQQRGLKVLIRDELDIGRKLYEVISKALRKSRKVIVLLSNDYCLDYWNVFEFNVAALEGIYTKRRVIIPVAFEVLHPEVFYEEIATFLKSEQVPRYTSDTNFIDLAEYLLGKVNS